MPQLDYLIIIPQVVWLFLIFTCFYFTLTYFFLPTLLKTIKVRFYFNKYFKSTNSRLSIELKDKNEWIIFELKHNFQNIKNKILFQSFVVNSVEHKIFTKKDKSKLMNLFVNATKNITIFYSEDLLRTINFYPSTLNLKKTNKQ